MINRIWDKHNRYKEGFLKEYTHWVLEVSYRQHTLGCYIIFCKRPIEKISDLKTEEITELPIVMKEIETALLHSDIFMPDRFNYLQMGNTLHHLHFHGIPRYKTKRTFLNKEWEDTTFGNPPVWSNQDVDDKTVIALKKTISLNI